MKRKIVVLSIIVVLFSVAIQHSISSNIVHAKTIIAPKHKAITNYNATSPYEYFNETKDPRYKLVARPLTLIQYPNKGYPAIITTNETLEIKIDAPEDTINWEFMLVSPKTNLTTQIIKTERNTTEWKFRLTIDNFTPGLYDLLLNCSAGFDYQTHSVKLLDTRSYPFTFIHISDSHFPAYTESEDINTTAIDLQKIEEIKAQNPDFVICTGDVIQGPTLVFADPTTGRSLAAEVQLKLALWALDKLDVPVFIIAGNHDYERSTLLPDNPRQVWKKYMGEPFVNFSYLDWSFVGFSSSFDGLSESEMQELNTILTAYDYTPITLFYHYNFRSQATSVINKHTVAIALYGHLHQEKLYIKNGTLYHCQDTLFHGAYSIFSILNSTSAEFRNKIYNFSQKLISATITNKTNLDLCSLFAILIIVPIYNISKKTKK